MCNASRPSRACPRPEPATVPCPTCQGAGRVPARHSDAALDALVQKVKES